MADDKKISGLTPVTKGSAGDLLVLVDISESDNKRITVQNIFASPQAIGSTTPSTGTFTTLRASSASVNTTVGFGAVGSLDYIMGTDGSDFHISGSSFGNEFLTIDSTGNVGIGTVTPDNRLTVSGDADVTGSLGVGTSSPDNTLTVSGDADFTGSVGIGTNTPGAALHIYGLGTWGIEQYIDSTDPDGYSALAFGNDQGGWSAGIWLVGSTNDWYGARNAFEIYQGLAAPMIFYTNAAEIARFDSDGNLGIATTTPEYKVEVDGDVKADAFRDEISWIQNQGGIEKLKLGYNSGGIGGGATPGNKVMNANDVAVFDTTTVDADSKGFIGAVFDGRYVYFIPNNNGSAFGQVTRYDTTGSFTDSGSWSVYDTTAVDADSKGFRGATFDGRYIYLAPYNNGSPSGQVTRYDTTGSFTDSGSWAVYDTTAVDANSKGFIGAIFDGRYVYFVPYDNGAYFGQVTRYDTTGSFTAAGSWSVYDTTAVDANSKGFVGAVFDGRYIYFVPYNNGAYFGQVTRYDTTGSFTAAGSWSVYDTTAVDADSKGFYGAVFDGRYIYFVPYNSGQTTRYDTEESFTSADSWSVFDTTTVNADSKGFYGGVFDGRYVYYIPHNNGAYFGQVTRYDTTGAFEDSSSWSVYDTTAVDADSKGFLGGVFDGRYIYLVPNNTGSASGQVTRLTGWAGGIDSQVSLTRIARSRELFIDSDENIGLGTTSPSYKLDVEGDINSSEGIRDAISWIQNQGGIEKLKLGYNNGGFGTGATPGNKAMNVNDVAVFDTTTVDADSKGFNGAVFDGRYLYFVPFDNGSRHGQVTRYDTTGSFTAAGSWAVFDTTTVDANSEGFGGAVFDGRYIYFAPYDNGAKHGQVTRYDTTGSFTDSGSWAVYDTTAVDANSKGFRGAVFDGRYVYLVPYNNGAAFGQVTRYDTTGSFTAAGSWSVYDTTAVDADSKGFYGAVFDGRYIYFVPYDNGSKFGQVTRYDTTATFTNAGSWTVYDTTAVNANSKGFQGAVFDGRYVYLVPHNNGSPFGQVTRYDTEESFTSADSWSVFDTTTVNADSKGFTGASFDGRYIYFVPNLNGVYFGQITRYDTTGSFTAAGSWSVYDTTTVDADSKGFTGVGFDGRYIYLVPNYNGARFGQVTRLTGWAGGIDSQVSLTRIARSSELFIDSDGYVGLNTTTPSSQLDVNGDIEADDISLSAPSNVYNLNHDSFSGYEPNEHIDHTAVSISAGTGLSGGGDISSSRTISLSHLGLESLSDPNDDRIIFWDDSAGATAWLDIEATDLSISAGGVLSIIDSGIDHDQTTNVHQDVNTTASPTFAFVTLNNTPINTSHAATKGYVDSVVQGLDWNESVISFRDFTTNEPAAPSLGDRYIDTTTGTSSVTAIDTTADYIYEWNGSSWTETEPDEGTAVWVQNDDVLYVFNGSEWIKFGTSVTHNNLSGLQGGAANEYYHLDATEFGYLDGQDQAVKTSDSPTFNNLYTTGYAGIGEGAPGTNLVVSDTSPSLRLKSEKNGTWVVGDDLANIEFYTSDASAPAGIHASIALEAETASGSEFGMVFRNGASAGQNTELMRIQHDGNVGIGTDSPDALLDLYSSSGTSLLQLGDSNSEFNYKYYFDDLDSFNLGLDTNGNKGVIYKTNEAGTYRQVCAFSDIHSDSNSTIFGISQSSDSGSSWNPVFVVQQGGRVGIGTGDPEEEIHVYSGGAQILVERTSVSASAPTLSFKKSRSDAAVSDDDFAGNIRFTFLNDAGTPETITGAEIQTQVKDASDGTEDADLIFNQIVAGSSTEVMRLHEGNVGIGTSTPEAPAEIKASGLSKTLVLSVDNVGGADYKIGRIDFQSNDSSANGTGNVGSILVSSDAAYTSQGRPGYMSFYTSTTGSDPETERLRITSTGNIGIATSAPEVNLHIADDGESYQTPLTGTVLLLDRTGTAANDTYLNIVSGNTGNAGIIFGDSDNDYEGEITYDNDNQLLKVLNNGYGIIIDTTGNVNITGASIEIGDITTSVIPYMSATGFADSPLSYDGTDIDFDGVYAVNLQNTADLAADGPSYWFDGSNDRVEIGDVNVDPGTDDYSIVCSFKANSSQSDTYGRLVSVRDGSTRFVELYVNTASPYGVRAGINAGAGNHWFDTGPTNVLDGQNHCGALVLDRDGYGKVYLDGNEESSADITSDNGSIDTDDFHIGSMADSSGNYFAGSISRTLLFNLALTEDEVKYFSNGGEVPYKYKGASQTDLIVSNCENRANPYDYDTFDGVSANGFHAVKTQTSTQANAGSADEISFEAGKIYRVTFDLTLTSGTAPQVDIVASIFGGASLSDEGWTLTADGSNSFVFHCDTSGTGAVGFYSLIISTCEYTVSNFKCVQIGCVAQYEPENITPDYWYDSSGNDNHGTVNGAAAINIPRLIGQGGLEVYDSSGTEVMDVDSNGNVTLNGTDPHLYINSEDNVYPTLEFQTGGSKASSINGYPNRLYYNANYHAFHPIGAGTGLFDVCSDSYNPIFRTTIAQNIVDYLQVDGGLSGSDAVTISTLGTDTNIDLVVDTKGTGVFDVNGDVNVQGTLYANTYAAPIGIEWDETNSSPTVTRLGSVSNFAAGSSPGDDQLPIHSRMRRCVLNDSGEVVYYLDPNDSTSSADGVTPANLDGTDGQVMVEIPKFYYKYEYDASTSKHRWWVSPVPLAGFSVHPAFVKNNLEVDYVYIGAYEGSMWDATTGDMVASADIVTDMYAAGDKLCSVSGYFPKTNETRDEFRSMASERGSGWHLQTYDISSAIQLLYITEYATWDSQTAIGEGRTAMSGGTWTANSYIGECGKSNGDGNGTNSVGGNTNDAYMTYRGIENFFGNVWVWVDGFNINNNIPYVTNNDSDFADDTSTNYTRLEDINGDGITLPSSNNYQVTLEQIDRGFLPASVGGSDSTYICDYYYQNSGWRVAQLGGNSDHGGAAGFFYWYLGGVSSHDNVSISSRLAYTGTGGIGVGIEEPEENIHVKTSTAAALIERRSADTTAPALKLKKSRNDGAVSDDDFAGDIKFQFLNDAGTPETIDGAQIRAKVIDASDGAEDVDLIFNQIVAGVNVEPMRFHEGNVGIGTDTPASILHVYAGSSGGGTPYSTNSLTIENDNRAVLQFLSPTTSNAAIYFGDSDASTVGQIYYDHSTDRMGFGSSGQDLNIKGNKIGIGVTEPGEKLDVYSTSNQIATFESNTTRSMIHVLGPEAVNNDTELMFGSDTALNSINQYASIRAEITQADPSALKADLVFSTNTGDLIQEKMRILSSGYVGIGTASPSTILHIEEEGTSLVERFTLYRNSEYGVSIETQRARGSESSPLILQDGDDVMSITGYGYDGNDFVCSLASITFEVDGTPGSDDMPGRIAFLTTPDGGTSAQIRMMIKNNGNIGIGDTSPNNKLVVREQATDTNLIGIFRSDESDAYVDIYADEDGTGTDHDSAIRFREGGNWEWIVGVDGSDSDKFKFAYNVSSLGSNTALTIDQSGNVGIGSETPGNDRVNITYAPSDNSGANGIIVDYDPAVTSTGDIYSIGISADSNTNITSGETNTGYHIALHGLSFHNSDGDLDDLRGLWLQYGNSTGGSPTGTTSAAYGIRLAPYASEGTITTLYDIYIGSTVTGGTVTNRYGIYQTESNDNYFAGKIGIGTDSPDNLLHVQNGSAGTVSPDASADELIIENSADAGISILSPDSSKGYLVFGSPSDNIGGTINWDYTNSLFTIGTSKAAGELQFNTGSASNAVRIDSNGNVGIGDASPTAKLVVTDVVQIQGQNVPSYPTEGSGVELVYDNNITGWGDTIGAGHIICYDRDNLEYKSFRLSAYDFKFSAGTDDLNPATLNIKNNGNVGINNDSPEHKLDVDGDIKVSGDLKFEDEPSDTSASGVTIDATSVGVTSFGQVLYLDSDGIYKLADADSSNTVPCVALAIDTGDGVGEILLQGFATDSSWSWTVGSPVYLSTTAGDLTQTKPSGSGDQVQAVGFATASDKIYFNPDYTVIEVA